MNKIRTAEDSMKLDQIKYRAQRYVDSLDDKLTLKQKEELLKNWLSSEFDVTISDQLESAVSSEAKLGDKDTILTSSKEPESSFSWSDLGIGALVASGIVILYKFLSKDK